MTALGIIARVVFAILAQPGTQDILSSAARRVVESATRQVMRSIVNRTTTRKSVDTFR